MIIYVKITKKLIIIKIPEKNLDRNLLSFLLLIKYNLDTIILNKYSLIFNSSQRFISKDAVKFIIWNFSYIIATGKSFNTVLIYINALNHIIIESFEDIRKYDKKKSLKIRLKIYINIIKNNII